ncbi:PTS glucose transporter subunit IIA [Paraglaciecola aquimarina]|uniref:PTS system glucose-specific EIIA component n=1 Tax=Paraglaciecola algarum TaxID=3050085 RepID=A0ABS9D1K2_9ALTE|nr:PTS glucose transporter subunit IIA [Paraglaciecola sp. G1-23]MCF2946746.1 PTS glucose transporter subunit IIA [Paraglaciecola sp. G1-23]
MEYKASMTLLGKLVKADNLPKHSKKLAISSPLSGAVVPLDEVPHDLFKHRLFGEGVAIKPSGYQVIAPFNGHIMEFPELANQIRLKAKNGLQIQIQLGIDSHLLMAEGFKRIKKPGDSFIQGDIIAEFSLIKMKKQLPSILCPVTLLNSEKVTAILPHYYSVIAGEDTIMSILI